MKKLTPSLSRRFNLRAFASRPALVGLTLLASGIAFVYLARAAAPPMGTMGPGSAPITFVGTAIGGSSAVEATCIDGVNCDVFKLTVTGTTADWAAKLISLNFSWLLPASDYDFYIHKNSLSGPLTGTGVNNGPPNTSDNAAIDPAASGVGDYFIHIVYFAANAADQYRGTATVSNKAVGNRTATYASSGITFGPNRTVKAPVAARDGEPSIRTDYKGNSYTGGIRGVPAGVDLWYFDLNAASPAFDPLMRVPIYRGQPDGTTEKTDADAGGDGGGDIDLAVAFPPFAGAERPVPLLAYSSLTLANIPTGLSRDRGVTFEFNPSGNLTGGPPGDDRQWHEFLGADTVYLLYRTVAPTIAQVQRSDDGGFTYGVTSSVGLIGQVGCLDVHQATGTVYAAGSSGSIGIGQPSVAGQAPTSADYTIRQAASDPNGVAHIFFVTKVADDGRPNGTVYALYSNGSDIFLKSSTDKGGSWNAPVQVNPPSGPLATNVNLFPWMETGPTPGSVGIVWYGTAAAVNNDNARWKVYFAQSFNADTATPAFRIAEVTEPQHFIHGSNISEMGLNPGAGSNRNLIDYFQVSFDPLGAAVIAYTDDHNDFSGNVFVARQITGPGIKGTTLPAVAEGAQLALPAATSGVPIEDVFPPRQPGLNGEQVTDFPLDVQTALLTRARTPDPLDFTSVRYDTSGTGATLAIAATMRVSNLTVVPAGSLWRASFAVNCPNAVLSADGTYTYGISDDGDQFFVQAQTTEVGLSFIDPGVQSFMYGKTKREPDGSLTYSVLGTADAGEFNMNDQTISIQVSVAKLNAVLAAASRPLITNGTVVAGLRAGAATVNVDIDDAPPEATRQGRRDITRGGTQFVVFDHALTPPPAVPTPTPLPPRAGTPGPTPPTIELTNISSRVAVSTGEKVGIAGFIVRGTAPKRLMVRGIGPALTGRGVPNALPDPVLEIRDGNNQLVATNNNWRSTQQAEITASGLAPTKDKEAAVIVNLTGAAARNNYTAQVRGAPNTAQQGVALIEVFDLDAGSFADLGNISTRGFVGTGAQILIGGLIVRDDSSKNQSQDILLRGTGPSLASRGINAPLQDPQLSLFNAQGTQLATNNDWNVNQDADIAGTTLAPENPKEAAIRRTLPPGQYTVQLSGVGGGTGIGIVEVFNLGNQ